MDKDMPADWALERAFLEVYGKGEESKEYMVEHMRGMATGKARARYIEAHEQSPVDPDLVTAREICAMAANAATTAGNYRAGRYDNDPEVRFTFAKLKEARGK
jgi:hypothetical protein